MARFEHSVIINRPIEDVWRFVAVDFAENIPKWAIPPPEAKQISDGPVGTGTTFQLLFRILGRQLEYNFRVIDFESNRKFSADFTNGIWKRLGLKDHFMLESVEEGKTKFTHVNEIEFRGLRGKLAWPVFARRRAGMKGEDAKLKRALET